MGWCAGRGGDQAAPPSLGPFLCNRRGTFFCVRRPRKSPRTEASAEFHVAGVVRDRSLSSFNEVDQEKSPLARTCRSPPQPAAARRSPPQPAAARRSPPQRAPRSARINFDFSASGCVFYSTRRKQHDLTESRVARFEYPVIKRCLLYVSDLNLSRVPGSGARAAPSTCDSSMAGCCFSVLAGACQFGTAWAGLRLNSFIHSRADAHFVPSLRAGVPRLAAQVRPLE